MASAHTQVLGYYGDTNTRYDVWPGVRHVSRMISVQGVPSPALFTSCGAQRAAVAPSRQLHATVARNPPQLGAKVVISWTSGSCEVGFGGGGLFGDRSINWSRGVESRCIVRPGSRSLHQPR